MFAYRKWEKFVKKPNPAITMLVREFYANLEATSDCCVYAHKKEVSFTASGINTLFDLPDLEQDNYNSWKDSPKD